MKSLIIILVTLFSVNVLAESKMTEAEIDAYLIETAKDLRRSYWVTGHEDVHSDIQAVSKESLDEYIESNNNNIFEDSLYSDEISELYRCHYSSTCDLNLIGVSGSYMGGYGETAHFILLDVVKEKHDEIAHTVYSE